MNSTEDIERQREHFNRIAAKYYCSRQDLRHLYLKRKIWEKFFSDIPLSKKENLHILEAMCGYGEAYSISQSHINQKFSFDAFDYSDNMVQYVRVRYPDMNVWTQDVTTFHTSQSYDLIYIIGGLHHVHKYASKVMQNIANSLVPGGLFINFEPTHNNFLFAAIRNAIYAKNSFFDKDTERGFTTKELDMMAQEHGLQVTKQMYPGLLAYVLWYNPDAFPLLNKGSLPFVQKFVDAESRLWDSKIARPFSFATLSCYQKA